MYRIIDKRGTGKTSRLFLLAKETGAEIVCADPTTFKKKAENLGIDGLKFLSYNEYYFIMTHYSKTGPVLIDELEAFIRYCDKNIIGYNMSLED